MMKVVIKFRDVRGDNIKGFSSDEMGYYLSGLTLIRVKGKKLVTKVYMG